MINIGLPGLLLLLSIWGGDPAAALLGYAFMGHTFMAGVAH